MFFNNINNLRNYFNSEMTSSTPITPTFTTTSVTDTYTNYITGVKRKRKYNNHNDIFKFNWTLSKVYAYLNKLKENPRLSQDNFEYEEDTSSLLVQNNLKDFIPIHISVANLNRILIQSLLEHTLTIDEKKIIYEEIIRNLEYSKIILPEHYNFDSQSPELILGEGISESFNPVHQVHITFILTASSNSIERCNFIKECLIKDLQTDQRIYIVMAQQDYNDKSFLERIGIDDILKVPNKIGIYIIPDLVRTAGYTRSWCIYLASVLKESSDTIIWIRDDRRGLYPGVSNNEQTRIRTLIANKSGFNYKHGTIYSPNGQRVTNIELSEGDWNKINQVICATKKTWEMIASITTYPQGPIFEDYYFSFILYEAGFTCSNLGPEIKIYTTSCESLARPGDNSSKYIKCPYYCIKTIELALQMARGVAPTITYVEPSVRYNKRRIQHAYFGIKIGTSPDSYVICNDPKLAKNGGGGQIHTIIFLWMLQQIKNKFSSLVHLKHTSFSQSNNSNDICLSNKSYDFTA